MTENDALTDVIHLASAALAADLTEVKRQVLADIYAEIGALLAVEKVSRGGAELQGLAKFLTVAEGVQLVRFAGKDEIKLVARRKGRSGNPNTIFEILVDKKLKCADVCKDGCRLFSILGVNVNYIRVENMAVSALHRWFDDRRPSKRARKRARRLREGIKEDK